MKFVLSALTISLLCVSCANNAHMNKTVKTESNTAQSANTVTSSTPKNIIMVVGDGDGASLYIGP